MTITIEGVPLLNDIEKYLIFLNDEKCEPTNENGLYVTDNQGLAMVFFQSELKKIIPYLQHFVEYGELPHENLFPD